MVEIAPFNGIMFSRAELEDHGGQLVAPPYDVLNPEEQRNCLNLHPHNILHLDFNVNEADEKDKFAWHRRSAEILKKWLEEGVLERLERPAIFQVETSCRNPVKGGSIVRRGFVCLMRLVDIDHHSEVRPHEKTFSSHKEERLNLMKATHANLSQVFGFFPDEDRRAWSLIRETTEMREPAADLTDYRKFRHRIWLEQDQGNIDRFKSLMKDRKVYIADGHHRYETALNYRDHLKGKGEFSPGADYVMIYLCPMSDPGLVILPTHRLFNGTLPHPDDFLNSLSHFFKISGKAFTDKTEPVIRDRFLTKLKKQRDNIGLYLAGRQTYYILKTLDKVLEELEGQGEPPELAVLDTVRLSGIILKKTLNLTEKNLDDPHVIAYVSNLGQALDLVKEKKHKAAFILNPSTVEDVIRVSEKGLTMPRKSTFFYPKVTTGLMFNLIDDFRG
ncbi:MAG: DUF1015 domain-containing protein [Candidatus Adiutrix sp.]|nr:DUF1015 domain-containing protein [Candidatus Adiutrix sp.]